MGLQLVTSDGADVCVGVPCWGWRIGGCGVTRGWTRATNAELLGAARIQHLQRGKGDSEDPAQPLKGRSYYGLTRFYELNSAYQLSPFFLRKVGSGLGSLARMAVNAYKGLESLALALSMERGEEGK